MPQLDSNTFIYQYIGVIITLSLIYIILSYIVLPLLLRSIFIRSAFLLLSATSTETTRLTVSERAFMHVKSKTLVFTLPSLLLVQLSYKVGTLIVILLNYLKNRTTVNSTTSSSLMGTMFAFVTLNYLILFLSFDSLDQFENITQE